MTDMGGFRENIRVVAFPLPLLKALRKVLGLAIVKQLRRSILTGSQDLRCGWVRSWSVPCSNLPQGGYVLNGMGGPGTPLKKFGRKGPRECIRYDIFRYRDAATLD